MIRETEAMNSMAKEMNSFNFSIVNVMDMGFFLSQPNSTSTQVGLDKVMGWPTTPHYRNL